MHHSHPRIASPGAGGKGPSDSPGRAGHVSGFLGHGISVGIGLSLARRLGDVRFQTYVLVSEDDMESGVAWEGALTAAKYRSSEPTVFYGLQ